MQELGLQTAYSSDDATHRFIRKLMACRSCLTTRSDRCSCPSAFRHRPSPSALTNYIQEQWIEGTIFTPKDWSVFKQPIRTNNDIEGWHNVLNRRAGGQCRLQFYLLIELLHREARLTSITIKLVSDKKLKRIQRRKYRQLRFVRSAR